MYNLHFSMCNYMKKFTKSFDEKSAFRVPEFLRFDLFSRMLLSLRAKGTSRKGKRASVVSIFRHSDSVTRIRFLSSYLSIFRLTLSYHFIVIKLLYHLHDHDKKTNTKRVSFLHVLHVGGRNV